MSSVIRRVDGWLFAPGSARRLAAVRIGLCSLLAVRLSRGVYLGLAGQPRALYRPISFMRLLPAMPSRWAVLVVQGVALAAAVLAAVGFRARATLPIAWGCALILNGMYTSIGKVMHNDILLTLCMVPLLAAPVADAWKVDPWSRRRERTGPEVSVRYGWPVRTAMIVVAGAYFFAGLAKLEFSGPAWAAGGNLRWALYASSDGQGGNWWALFIADRPLLAHALAWGALLLELGFPLVLFGKRAAWVILPAAVALHTGIWLAMHLDYFGQVATVVVVMTNWPAVIHRLRNRRARSPWAQVEAA
jgi:hypothetical protein